MCKFLCENISNFFGRNQTTSYHSFIKLTIYKLFKEKSTMFFECVWIYYIDLSNILTNISKWFFPFVLNFLYVWCFLHLILNYSKFKNCCFNFIFLYPKRKKITIHFILNFKLKPLPSDKIILYHLMQINNHLMSFNLSNKKMGWRKYIFQLTNISEIIIFLLMNINLYIHHL